VGGGIHTIFGLDSQIFATQSPFIIRFHNFLYFLPIFLFGFTNFRIFVIFSDLGQQQFLVWKENF